MKKALFLALALSLSACAHNPLTLNRYDAIQSSYGIALSAALGYSKLPRCASVQVSTVLAPCAQTAVIRKLKTADLAAQAALDTAHDAILGKPSISTLDALQAADAAVNSFLSIQSSYGIR